MFVRGWISCKHIRMKFVKKLCLVLDNEYIVSLQYEMPVVTLFVSVVVHI